MIYDFLLFVEDRGMSRHTIKRLNNKRTHTIKYRGGYSSTSTGRSGSSTSLNRRSKKNKRSSITPSSLDKEKKIRAKAIAIERVKAKIKDDLLKLDKMRIELEEAEKRIAKEEKEIADEKERKAKMKPVLPPKLKNVESKVTSEEFEYLKEVLRSLGKLSSHREKKDGKTHIYYKLDDLVKALKVQILAVNKHHKSKGYEFLDETHRKTILIQLTKYIQYFEYISFLNRVDDNDLEKLFDGIED